MPAYNSGKRLITMYLALLLVTLTLGLSGNARGAADESAVGRDIEVDAAKVTGKVEPFMFGQFMEHEHKTFQGGLWAELLRDRKFEQGDVDRDGVSDGWVPEERITNRSWELANGQSANHRYFVDHKDYYGGGASQAIELMGQDSGQTSVYQIGIQVVKGRRYAFYIYLTRRGEGKAWVEFGKRGGALYGRKEFQLSKQWAKYTAEFVASDDTEEARLRIGVEGHGTFWMDSASLMPADNLRGMRADVMEVLRPLHIPLMRYPGGCFADEFHWKNEIGPRDQRPTTWSDIWQEWDPNDFGIDEFMDFAKELGFQGHITTNYSSGTSAEAAEWVEYMNGSADTLAGKLRARNGHPEPYMVKFWAVGNEPAESCSEAYTGGTDIAEYVKRFREYKAAMQAVDPSIRMLAGGVPPGPAAWNRDLLGRLPGEFDFLAVSIYTGKEGTECKICDPTDFYRQVVFEPQQFEQRLDEAIAGMGDRFPRDHPFVAVTEYNSWWMPESGDPDYRLCNALYLAGVYHALLRHANQVGMAEWNTTINVQGLVSVDPAGLKLPPPYFAYLLYHDHIGAEVLSTQTRSPMVAFNPKLRTLDAVATLGQDGHTLYLAVINRSEGDDMETAIRLNNWTPRTGVAARAYELNGKDRDAANAYGNTENVHVREKTFSLDQNSFSYRFPAHSVTVLEITGERRTR